MSNTLSTVIGYAHRQVLEEDIRGRRDFQVPGSDKTILAVHLHQPPDYDRINLMLAHLRLYVFRAILLVSGGSQTWSLLTSNQQVIGEAHYEL